MVKAESALRLFARTTVEWLWVTARGAVAPTQRRRSAPLSTALRPGRSGLTAGAAQAFARELDAVRVVNQAIEYGIGVGGITEHRRMIQFSNGWGA